MNVAELKKKLNGLPDDMLVILQKDSEGNSYSPLYGADPNAVYVPETDWAGRVYDLNWSADDADMSEDEWQETRTKPKVLVLHPTN